MGLSDTTVRLARAKGKDYDLDGLSLFVRAKGTYLNKASIHRSSINCPASPSDWTSFNKP